MNRKTKTILIILLFLAVIGMAIGYAANSANPTDVTFEFQHNIIK